jgi:hypothetical protein
MAGIDSRLEALEKALPPELPIEQGAIAELRGFYDIVLEFYHECEKAGHPSPELSKKIEHARYTLDWIVDHPSAANPQWPEQYATMILTMNREAYKRVADFMRRGQSAGGETCQ